MPVVFSNTDVAEKYEAVAEKDKQIRLIRKNWQGNLSTVTLEIADELHRQQATDLLKLKAPVKASTAAKEKEKDKG